MACVSPGGVARPPLTLAERQLGVGREHEHVGADEVGRAVVHVGVDEEVVAAVVLVLLVGVVGQHRVAAREAPSQLCLEGVVAALARVAEVVDPLRPAVGAAQPVALSGPCRRRTACAGSGRTRAEADERGLVRVRGRVVAEEPLAAVAHVGDLRGERGRQLALERHVVGVDVGQVLLVGQQAGERPRWAGASARSAAPAGKTGADGPVARLNTLSKLLGGFSSCGREHRQVLCHGVAEGGPEHADVVAAPVAGADHGLGVDLVRDAEAWRPVDLVLDVALQVDVAHAADADLAGVDVQPAAVARLVHGLRVDDVGPQPVVEGQLRGGAPGVLDVEELAPLGLPARRCSG